MWEDPIYRNSKNSLASAASLASVLRTASPLPCPQNAPSVVNDFDYAFSENGLTAYKMGKVLGSDSFIGFVGEEKYKTLVNFILHYIADLDIPMKRFPPSVVLRGVDRIANSSTRGTFVEFRTGMINVSPIGRNARCALFTSLDHSSLKGIQSSRAAQLYQVRQRKIDVPRGSSKNLIVKSGTWSPCCLRQSLEREIPRLRSHILHWRTNFIRHLPKWVGQDLLSSSC